MKPQRQTTFGGPKDENPGNCWSTCIAMLLGIDTSEVPNFCGIYREEDGTWLRKANEWLREKGALLMPFNDDPVTWAPECDQLICIASGPAERGHPHSVVWKGGKILHDPHPSDAGLIEAREWEVLIISDPVRFAAFLRERDAVPVEPATFDAEPFVQTGHRWSGWPGPWCLDCGIEGPEEDGQERTISPTCPKAGEGLFDPYRQRPQETTT